MTAGVRGSIRGTARLAGGLYLALAAFSFFGIIFVPSVLVVPGDPAVTSGNILASEWLFRTGIVSHLIGQVILILLGLVLYRVLKPVNANHAGLMVVLVLVQVPILFLNELNSLAILRVLHRAGDGAFTPAQLHAAVMLFIDLREKGILVAQVFMGLWLLPLGCLVFKSGFLPKLLGILVLIAGAGYLIDWSTQLLFQGIPTVSQFTFIGELLLALWLLIRGVDVARWQEVARDARRGAA